MGADRASEVEATPTQLFFFVISFFWHAVAFSLPHTASFDLLLLCGKFLHFLLSFGFFSGFVSKLALK